MEPAPSPALDGGPALLLVSRGSPDLTAREAAATLAERVLELRPGALVGLGFLTYLAPGVPEAVQALVLAGAREVVAVSLVMHDEGLISETLPRVLRRAARRHPHVRIRLGRGLDLLPETARLIARAAADAQPVPTRTVSQDAVVDAYRRERQVLRPYRRHALMCVSTYCAERGAAELYLGLRAQMDVRAETEPAARVQVTRTACLGLCGAAPAMVVYPEGTWYAELDRGRLERVRDEHLVGGRPVDGLVHGVPRSGHRS